MSTPDRRILDAGRIQAGMSFEELWMAYFALGGTASARTIRSYLLHERPDPVTDSEYDLLAQAINERFLDQGQDHPLPYRDELP
jgi:hypothetical protein